MAGPRQIVLPLDWTGGDHGDEILVTPANRAVLAALEIWPGWPGLTAILTGPPRSGKSLIARRFARQSGGTALDDADRLDNESIFHAWNRAQAEQKPLLLTSRLPPARWHVPLPDLRSRLGAALHLEMADPDEEMMALLIVKHLAARGTGISPDALAYAEKRIERSYEAAEDFAVRANEASLAEGRPITLSLVKPIIAGQSELEL